MFQVDGKIGLQLLVLDPLSESETHGRERCPKRSKEQTWVLPSCPPIGGTNGSVVPGWGGRTGPSLNYGIFFLFVFY